MGGGLGVGGCGTGVGRREKGRRVWGERVVEFDGGFGWWCGEKKERRSLGVLDKGWIEEIEGGRGEEGYNGKKNTKLTKKDKKGHRLEFLKSTWVQVGF